MKINLRVDNVKIAFYPNPEEKTWKVANFSIIIENGYFRLIDNNTL
jgi:hypothetical protein